MRTLAATLLAFALITAPAAAQASATATPNTAGKGTKLHTELDATQPPVNGRIPTETVLSIQDGYRFDGRAVARRCTPEQAGQDKCPARSRVGLATVNARYQGMPITLVLRLYLTRPQQAGDIAGFAAVTEFFGTRSVIGRVIRTDEDPFGIQVVLPTPGGDLSNFGATFESFSADIGATRVVKRKVGKGKKRRTKRTRHHLIRNPSTCAGTWASRATFTFGDGSTASVDAPIACAP